MKDKGVVAVNVLANRDMLKRLSSVFDETFEAVHVLAMNPNYLFFLSNDEGFELDYKGVKELLEANPSTAVLTEDLCRDVIAKTAIMEAKGTLLGWYDIETFNDMVDTVDCV